MRSSQRQLSDYISQHEQIVATLEQQLKLTRFREDSLNERIDQISKSEKNLKRQITEMETSQTGNLLQLSQQFRLCDLSSP